MDTYTCRSIRLLILWLSLGLGCKQTPPLEVAQLNQPAKTAPTGPVEPTTNPNTCDDGTCCGKKGVYYVPTGTNQLWATVAETCTLTGAPVENAILTYFGRANYDDPIKCRIWGRVYTADRIYTLTGMDPLRYFAVDRVEVLK
jgi:hypothetical protein